MSNTLNLKLFDLIDYRSKYVEYYRTAGLEKFLRKHQNNPDRSFLNIVRPDDGYTPIMVASFDCRVPHFVLLLEEHGADLLAKDTSGKNILEVVGAKSFDKPKRSKILSFLIRKLREKHRVVFDTEIAPKAFLDSLLRFDELEMKILFEHCGGNVRYFDVNKAISVKHTVIYMLVCKKIISKILRNKNK